MEVKRIRIIGEVQSGPVATTKIEAGNIIAKNSAGYLVHASNTAGLLVVGVARETVDNSAGAPGALNCEYDTGVFEITGSGFSETDWKEDAFIVDSKTVAPSNTNSIFAGKCYKYFSATKIWVDMRMHLEITALAAAEDITVADAGGIISGTTVEDALQEIQGNLGGGTTRVLKIYEFWYDFAIHAGTQGAITLTKRGGASAQALPDNFVPLSCWYEVEDALTSSGSATVKVGTTQDDDAFMGATAFDNAALAKEFIGVPATKLGKCTAACSIIATIAGAALTDGRFNVYVLGVQGA